MTLPTSGALTLADIQTEFGGSNPIGLSEYYAGGAYVPAGTSGTYGAVPSSGTISIQNFYGTQAALDVQTVTVGVFVIKSTAYYGYGPAGSISDGTFNPKGGASITRIEWISVNTLIFSLSGSYTNADWTTVEFTGGGGTYSFNRTAASYSISSGETFWQWTTGTNPFGTTTGVNVTATFT